MDIKPKQIEVAARDGTSQARRVLAALDPSYVAVDERTATDFLAFAGKLGTALKYYGADGQPAGDFSQFIGAVSAADVAAFLSDPERFDPQTAPALFRPHYVLFLAFIKLLQKAQVELNSLTGRHLDFYYRQFLGMEKNGPIPDQVHVVFNLAPRGSEVLVARGTLLSAGPDSLGVDRRYATDRDLVVNRAQVATLSSLYVDRRLIGFAETRARASASGLAVPGLALLGLALGEPGPGDPLPAYPGGVRVDDAKLKELDGLTQVTTVSSGYYLSLSELRDLFRLKDVVDPLKLTPAHLDEQWSKINDLLTLAGQRKRNNDPAYRLPAGFDPRAFTQNAALAVGKVAVPGRDPLDMEAYLGALRELETYFFMTAEDFHQVYLKLTGQSMQPWDRIDLLLEAAHADKVRRRFRLQLQKLHSANSAAGLAPLIAEVLGNPAATQEDLLPFLDNSLTTELADAATGADWDRVYSILEVARRNRLGPPVAQREEWLNLHPAADATKVGARQSVHEEPTASRWATFGLPVPSDPAAPPAPVLGWAVSSPLLSLSEGVRTIWLTLGLGGNGADAKTLAALLRPPAIPGAPPQIPLSFEVSTEKGWMPCAAVDVTIGSYAALAGTPTPAGLTDPLGVGFKLVFGKSAGPITTLPAELAAIKSPYPVLRLLLRPVWSADRKQYLVRYRELGGLLVLAAHLQVAVKGLRSLKLQSDEAELDARKPFEPFGSLPATGSRLRLGHPELLNKKLDSLAFNLKWMGAPADLVAHYLNYDGLLANFTAKISLVERGEVGAVNVTTPLSMDAKAEGAFLFPDNKGDAATTWNINSLPPSVASLDAEGTDAEDLASWPRYFQWELGTPDLQHSVYATVAAAKALALATDIANKKATIKASDYLVKPPYTPKLQSLSLDYGASQDVLVGGAAVDAAAARLLHIHPFGHCDVEAERTAAGVPLLPRYDNDGELYLGIGGLLPPQTVSLFFQLAEGTSDPELAPQTISWSYLDADRWVALGSRVLLDSTRGLLNSGVVELGLLPARPSTRLRGDLYWVRAAISRNTAVVCDTIAINTQSVSATFTDQGNAPDHYGEPLPAGAVTKLVTQVPLLAGVRQPYASFGGQLAESDALSATRVSERLRHKQRALTMWDYERLVLARFPQVYKAKCLPARPADRGKVGIVIIPDIKNFLPADPFAPKAPARLLSDIEAYLGSKTPAYVSVKVRNARYVPVRVRLRVRFREEGNESFYQKQLNDELNRFLSPWAYEEGADIALGGRIYANSLIDFADRRPYVDYVAGVTLFSSEDGERFFPSRDDFVEASDSDVVLVAARTHIIDVLHDAFFDEKQMTGIGFLKVELDFIVGA